MKEADLSQNLYQTPELGIIQEQQRQHADLIVEPITAPFGRESLRSATFRQITQRLLPTLEEYQDLSLEQIASMTQEQRQVAVTRLNQRYAFRGVVVSLGDSDIGYTALPRAFSGEDKPTPHSLKSLASTLTEGDTIKIGDSTYVSGYELDGTAYEPNKFIAREIDGFNLSMAYIAQDDPTFIGKEAPVFPAILVYKRSNLEHVWKYQYRFKPSPTNNNPKREALAAAFIVPKISTY